MPVAIRIPVTSSGDEESSSRETERGRQPEWERDGLKTEKVAIQSKKKLASIYTRRKKNQ